MLNFFENKQSVSAIVVAAGSGTSVVDVNRLLKQFEMMQQMTKQMSKGKMPAMFGGKKMKGGKKGFFGF